MGGEGECEREGVGSRGREGGRREERVEGRVVGRGYIGVGKGGSRKGGRVLINVFLILG